MPARLRRALGTLIGGPTDDIILANSASYGLHLLANGIPFEDGDEVRLVESEITSKTKVLCTTWVLGAAKRQSAP